MTYEYVVLRVKPTGRYYYNNSPYGITRSFAVAEGNLAHYRRDKMFQNDPLAIYFRKVGNPSAPFEMMAVPSEFVCPT